MKTLMISAIGLLIAAVGTAQNFEGKKHGQGLMHLLDSSIALSAEQKANIVAINERYKVEYQNLRKDATERNEATKVASKELRIKHKEELMAELSPDQQDALKEKMKAKKAESEALRKELAAYRNANIKPVMKAYRKKLEAELSQEEKNTIAALRKEMKQGDRKGDGKKTKDFSKEQRQGARAQLEPIAKNHETFLKNMETELAPKRAQWEQDMHAIRKSHVSEIKGEHPGKYQRKGRDVASFLLMKP